MGNTDMRADTTRAQRNRRYRERLKSGTVIAQVEIPFSLAEAMTRMGLIEEPFAPRVCGPLEMLKRGEALLQYIRLLNKRA